jgi:hypothetical protein
MDDDMEALRRYLRCLGNYVLACFKGEGRRMAGNLPVSPFGNETIAQLAERIAAGVKSGGIEYMENLLQEAEFLGPILGCALLECTGFHEADIDEMRRGAQEARRDAWNALYGDAI